MSGWESPPPAAPDPADRGHGTEAEAALSWEPSMATPVSQARLRGSDSRMWTDRLFRLVCIVTAGVSVLILLSLLVSITLEGVPALSWTLLNSAPEPDPSQAGLRPALFGTLWVCSLCALVTLPVGIATAILLEEFPPKSRWARSLHHVIQLNISNLAGVPSVVYGILGLTAFVAMFGLFRQPDRPGAAAWEVGVQYYDQFFSEGARAILVPVEDPEAPLTTPREGMLAYGFEGNRVDVNVLDSDDPYPEDPQVLAYTLFEDAQAGRISEKSWYYLRLPLGRGVLAGALTLMLVILPVIIISTQEALRSVPRSLRAGALGLGATPWQVVWNVTLPASVPGIMTGSILAMSRAIGETAPILIIAGIVYIRSAPQHVMDDFTVLPLQIYNWTSRPQEEFHVIAAGGIVILLLILLFFNGIAVLIRHKMHKPLS